MRVRMRRRYRNGLLMTQKAFAQQPWTHGMLTLQIVEGREQLGLWESCPGQLRPPFGLLWRPLIAACVSDTITFAGIEKDRDRWSYQVWYCEVGSKQPDPGDIGEGAFAVPPELVGAFSPISF